jgi:hypothetical protein
MLVTKVNAASGGPCPIVDTLEPCSRPSALGGRSRVNEQSRIESLEPYAYLDTVAVNLILVELPAPWRQQHAA